MASQAAASVSPMSTNIARRNAATTAISVSEASRTATDSALIAQHSLLPLAVGIVKRQRGHFRRRPFPFVFDGHFERHQCVWLCIGSFDMRQGDVFLEQW